MTMPQRQQQNQQPHHYAVNIVSSMFSPGRRHHKQLEAVVPPGVNAVTFVANWVSHVRAQAAATPKWWVSVKPEPLIKAFLECAALGLQPDPKGHVYIVPYKGVPTVIIGYKGMLALMKRLDAVSHVDAAVVYDCDEFDYMLGLNPQLHHRPDIGRDEDAKLIGAYAVCIYENGERQMYVMPKVEIERLKRQYQGNRSDSPWKDWTDRMARKSAIRQLFSLVGTDDVMTKAALISDREFMGQHIEPARLEAPPKPADAPMAPAFAADFIESASQPTPEPAPA